MNTVKHWVSLPTLAVALFALAAACAPAASPSPTAAPAKPAESKPAATTAPAAPKPTEASAAKPAESKPAEAKPAASPAAKADAKPAASPAAKAAPPEVTDLKVGIVPIAPLTPVYLAAQRGFFKEEGFNNVELVQLASGAESVSVVASGRVHLAQTTYVSILQARDENFDLIAVANLDNATNGTLKDGRKDVGGLMVAQSSPIQRPRDLEGKKVGVSSVPGILWMFVAETIRQDGADHKKVNFQEVPFAQMTDVLVNGGIDAGAHLEPFTTVALQGGKVRAIAWPYVDVLPSANLGGIFGKGDWVRSNPNTAAAFERGLRRGMDVMKDDAEARKWIIEYTKMNPELAGKMWLSVWNTKVDLKSVEKQRDIMLDMGMLKKKIEPTELFYRTALE